MSIGQQSWVEAHRSERLAVIAQLTLNKFDSEAFLPFPCWMIRKDGFLAILRFNKFGVATRISREQRSARVSLWPLCRNNSGTSDPSSRGLSLQRQRAGLTYMYMSELLECQCCLLDIQWESQGPCAQAKKDC